MRRTGMTRAGMIRTGTLALVLSVSGVAGAQETTDPDIRNIRPVVMLLVDTSGSMERMSGGEGGELPVCSGTVSGTNQRNRWTTVLEALTGSWPASAYSCQSVPRNTAAFVGQPDYQYYHPYHRPPSTGQLNDGVLDVYLDRVKFGLMTFDNTYTFRDAPEYVNEQLVPRTTFLSRLIDNASRPGEYSYGDARPLTFPGCVTTFMVDTGARNEDASMGAMVSVGDEADDPLAINQRIQDVLLNVRPYGATPTSSLLHDFRFYVQSHSDMTTADPFASCRDRYALLLTDGQPDPEFRDDRFNCAASDGCPYERASTIASDLCRYNGTSELCEGAIDGVFVVAFDLADAGAIAELNEIASVGGTGAALLASNREELLRRIGEVLDRAAPGTTTRTRPAFVTGGSTFSSGVAAQLEFNAGFQVGNAGRPWTGVLERTRHLCNAELVAEAEDPSDRVQFHEELNARTAARRLYTVVTTDAGDLEGNLIGTQADAVPLGAATPSSAVTGVSLVPFNTTNVTPAHLGLSGGSTSARQARRDTIVSWVHGTTPDREGARMGDIYHSSPVAVGPPLLDIADESYNLFRRRPEVATRPTIVYVGTNDGVLHAFVAEDWQNPESGERLDAGHELWGFVPPILLPKLDAASSSHQIMVDGTPVVRDIFYRRLPNDAPNGDIYHTVLLMGFRAGAPGYFALDVTDPFNPEFLWQFVGDQPSGRGGGGSSRTPLGYSYGRPAIGQVLVEVNGTLQERAVALLPGGSGELDGERVRTTGPVGCPAQGVGQPPVTGGTTNARSRQRCWSNRGRILTWVDIVTGEVIRTFDESVFGAPLTGGVALYPGDVGSVAERAFLTDADGVVWAVDFSKRQPANWEVRQFHDIFWDATGTAGQPAYDPPVVSVDTEGNLVVLIATGDIDRLDSAAENRVVSLLEKQRPSTTTSGIEYSTELNWELRLRPGEQVTGQLELFEGTVYFASFESASDPSNMCAMGQSRIWGLDYFNAGSPPATGYLDVANAFPMPRFGDIDPDTGEFEDHFMGPFDNQLVLGVGVTQRPTCIEGVNESDPYIGQRYRVRSVGGGTFELSAQVSGGSRGADGAVATINVQLPTPQSFTTVTGFAGRVDY